MADKCLHCLKNHHSWAVMLSSVAWIPKELHALLTWKINLCHSQLVCFPSSFLQYLHMVWSSVPEIFLYKFSLHTAPSLRPSKENEILNNCATLLSTHDSSQLLFEGMTLQLYPPFLHLANSISELCAMKTLALRNLSKHKTNTFKIQIINFHLEAFLDTAKAICYFIAFFLIDQSHGIHQLSIILFIYNTANVLSPKSKL